VNDVNDVPVVPVVTPVDVVNAVVNAVVTCTDMVLFIDSDTTNKE
jgi:hypothetical protein